MKANYKEFSDPRLVAIYNTVCPIDEYETFYIKLAKKLSVRTILDLGSGTGLLICSLAKEGFQMIGVEPSRRMLEVAYKNPYGKDVWWIEGSALSLGEYNADLAIMTGHVAQFHIEEDYWSNSLTSTYNALRPGGYLAFESRNPAVQPWINNKEHRDWHSATTPSRKTDPIVGPLETWSEPSQIVGERVTFEEHYRFITTGEELTSTNELIFRTREEITYSLENAGFSVETVYGNWDWRLATSKSPEFIFIAKRK